MVIFGAVNEAMFDWPWSGIHFVSGFLIGALLAILFWKKPAARFWIIGIAILVLWETTEGSLRFLDANFHQAIAPFKQSVAGFAFAHESNANILGDLIIGSVGLFLGRVLVGTVNGVATGNQASRP